MLFLIKTYEGYSKWLYFQKEGTEFIAVVAYD